MRRIASILFVVVALHLVGCSVREDTKTLPEPAERTEWKLPSGLILDETFLDVSDGRDAAIVWGARVVESDLKCSCWLIDLHTGKTTNLLTLVDDANAAPLLNPGYAQLSPDGKHVLIVAEDDLNACVVDLATAKSVLVTRPDSFRMMWAGNRLLLSLRWELELPEVLDVTGRHIGTLPLRGELLASDVTGTTFLAIVSADHPSQQDAYYAEGTVVVVTDKGRIVRKVAPWTDICRSDWPLLSRAGNWAGSYCKDRNGWAYSLLSTTTDEVFRLERPYGETLLLTDSGESIFLGDGWDTTFWSVMHGEAVEDVYGRDIVFWPKDDGRCESEESAPAESTSKDFVWNTMPRGQSRVLASSAIAVAALREELFYVQVMGEERILKAIQLPKPQTTSLVADNTEPLQAAGPDSKGQASPPAQ